MTIPSVAPWTVPLAVAAGGALGALARYQVGLLAERWLGAGFPWGTLLVNIVGSFVMGLLVGAAAGSWSPGPAIRAFLMVGVLGGFTTFSAFSLDAVLLLQRGDTVAGVAYMALSVVGSLLALLAGLALAHAPVP